jgi:hypothetical protein
MNNPSDGVEVVIMPDNNPKEPFLVDPGWTKSIFVPHTGGDSYRVLFYKDGNVRFEHRCVNEEQGGSVIAAPSLSKHTIESKKPLTISPSILCPRCNLHGFITAGRWVEA